MRFWTRHPAFLLGLSFLIGTAASLRSPLFFAALFLCLIFTAHKKTLATLALALGSIAYLTTPLRYPSISLSQDKISGVGIFQIEELKPHSSPFHKSLLYKGKLLSFKGNNGVEYRDLSCSLFHPLNNRHPPANCNYEIQGILCQKNPSQFALKPTKTAKWIPQRNTHSFAEWRYLTKRAIGNHLKEKIPDIKTRHLLTALATGDIDERILSMEFGKVGLQHILAVSGFHFGCVGLFIFAILRFVLPETAAKIGLLIAISLYYFFLGNAPSIQRAYIAISLVVFGSLFGWKITGLNALGTALLFEIALSPSVIEQLSFQLSFLCTLAILLFYPPMLALTQWVFPKRTYAQVKEMSLFEQHVYVIIHFLRQSLALNLAVHFISIPILLHLFHKFPLLSIAYNLLFPFCISISMFLLCASLLFAPIFPFLSNALHAWNNTWTSWLLQYTTHPPAAFEFALRSNKIDFRFAIGFLCLVFFFAAVYQEREREKRLHV